MLSRACTGKHFLFVPSKSFKSTQIIVLRTQAIPMLMDNF